MEWFKDAVLQSSIHWIVHTSLDDVIHPDRFVETKQKFESAASCLIKTI